jgi:2'-5' RNA ligase
MRLFLAFTLAKSSVEQLAADVEKVKETGIAGRYVLKEQYHVTIAFLGEQSEETAALLAKKVESLTFAPVSVLCEKTARFGKTVVLKLHKDVHMKETVDFLRQFLEAEKIEYDQKPFVPHITLARRAENLDWSEFSFPESVTLEHTALYESKLTPTGPVYRILAQSKS